jgi:hypothetical protein
MEDIMRLGLTWLTLAATPWLLAACGGGSEAPATPAPIAEGTPVAALSLLPAPALPPAAGVPGSGTYECRNVRIGAVDIDTVSVPAGAVCVLDGTRLIGSILVNRGAVVDARNVRVLGNLQADGASDVVLAGSSSINGSVQIKQGGSALVLDTRIGGDLQFFTNRGALLAQGNRVGGSIQAEDNTGGLTLNDNVANGNLQCKQNQPAPTGSGNRAASIEDQCRNLAPATTPPPAGTPTPPTTPPPALPPATGVPSGGTFTCNNQSVGAIDADTVVVPNGARCALDGTRLIGSLLVQFGAEVDARDVAINGNLQAEGAARVAVGGASRIGGSVQIVQSGEARIEAAAVTGDIQLTANRGLLWVQANRVGGSIQVVDNRGGALLYDNRIVGNLQCKQNQPAPDGRGNTAALKEDQCATL